MSEKSTTAARFLILSSCAPLFHILVFCILSFSCKATRCEDFVRNTISDLCEVYLCIFSAILLAQLALIICHFVYKPISHRALIVSAIFTSGASLLVIITSQVILAEIHTSLNLTVGSCRFPINLYVSIL